MANITLKNSFTKGQKLFEYKEDSRKNPTYKINGEEVKEKKFLKEVPIFKNIRRFNFDWTPMVIPRPCIVGKYEPPITNIETTISMEHEGNIYEYTKREFGSKREVYKINSEEVGEIEFAKKLPPVIDEANTQKRVMEYHKNLKQLIIEAPELENYENNMQTEFLRNQKKIIVSKKKNLEKILELNIPYKIKWKEFTSNYKNGLLVLEFK